MKHMANPTSSIPRKTQQELGWPALVAALASQARSALGREHAFALPFLHSREEVQQRLSRIAEARFLSRQSLEIPVEDVPDVRPHILRASREGILEPLALLECTRLLRASVRVRRFLLSRSEHLPILAGEAEALSDFEPLAAEIERAIEPSGTLSDNASVELAELRARARGLHRAMKTRLDEILEDPTYEEVLREKYYSVRDDRYVVPVIASHRSRLPGIVHNASQTGQTLFVEPSQLIELGNQLTIAESLAREEELRILRDFTEGIGRRAEELDHDLELLAELDRVGACARLAEQLDATEPVVDEPDAPFSLRGLRHPLLVLRGIDVVANDVLLQPGKRGLIISGPNAGGKTITLTAVGLSALMLRAGLPVPASKGSRLPLYDAVLTAIGDEGDLTKDLSTFTAHLTALRDIAERTQPGTLVCIDEIAADTDPREGAALASAMLDELADRGAYVLITTHLDELKAKAMTDERFASASVEFDRDKLAPTYRLALDRVGASSAIEIARRVGLPAHVCDRARELLGGAGGALVRAIESMESQQSELERLQRVLEEERQALALARLEWERQRRELQAKERDVQAGARRELIRDIEQAREEVRRTLAKLQAKPTVSDAVATQKKLEQEAREQEAKRAREEAEAAAIRAREAAEGVELRVGLRVRVASVDGEGEVLELGPEEALVRIGALKIRVPRGDLVALTGRAKPAPGFRKTKAERLAAADRVKAAPASSGARRLDIRGMRTEDALRELRALLDAAYQDDAREVIVLHGHGTGALKAAIRDELKSSPYVSESRAGEGPEGGDAVTVAILANRG